MGESFAWNADFGDFGVAISTKRSIIIGRANYLNQR
jgi:hypothetical protein